MSNLHLSQLRKQIIKTKNKMKKLATLLICFSLVFSVFANSENEEGKNPEAIVLSAKLSGKVIDKATGETLAGVKIRLNNSDQAVYTDFDGNFEITNIKPGKTEIVTTYISYKETTEVINISLSNTNIVEVKIENIIE